MGRMAGVWSCHTIQREAVEAVVVAVEDEEVVRTQSAMNVVSLVTLPESVACALVQEAWEVDGVEVLVPDVAGVQAMGGGAIARVTVPVEEGHQGVTASLLLAGVGALAGLLPHTAVPAVIHPMVMEYKAGVRSGCNLNGDKTIASYQF